MGQKASTPATSGQQSPRSRTFSSSSTGAADQQPSSNPGQNRGGGNDTAGQGFNLLRTLPGLQVYHNQNSTSIDRQRARSLSSVPDIQQQQSQQQQQQQGSITSSGSSPHSHPHAAHGHPAVGVSVSVSGNANANSNSNSGFPAAGNNNGSATQSYIQQRRTLGDSIRDMSMTGGNIAESIALAASATSANGIGRVYTATSLPSHIWSFNGIKCPVCNKFVLPDDIECHLVMCLTKPRLSYNEDVLSDAKGECVICLEDLSPGDTIARLPCLCIYHKGCIDRWFEVNRSCPEHPGD
ncbi:E3 ubiquitin-protein ligase znrf2 [Drosophila subpulchrella]|uniref:E3 ubiquitin-protein ligase znrf2 n=1 Tax=Drosophila subpulchrella TaxID=1486046 RepID=UPI0018A17B01|nr:E3 ubiquitin-protein ligase znrf2 [Drosophila subpulchrella]XP_037725611.1 E3 ubiquitin-protein ligase znrf2 [Drosophila subpulchrella]XP_037725612.1 E3 ubiquitin-protein ligase znrf2 [Drosophila subpulchrella]